MVFTISKSVNINGDDKGCVWRQVLISFLASIPFFTYGVETTKLSTSAHSGHFNTIESEDIWRATAMVIGAMVSAPLYCYVIDKYGRRSGIYFISLMQGASCIPLFLPPSLENFIILHVFAGFSSGGIFTVLPSYLREITCPETRGVMLLPFVMTTAGYLIKLVMDEEGMMFLMVALIALQLIGMSIMVESPAYLVMAGKLQTAKTNIASLKCLPEMNPTVTKELDALIEERDRARTVYGRLSIIGIFRSPIYRDVMKIGVVLYTVMVLCGSTLFLDQEKALAQLKMNLDPEKTLIICCLFSGSFFTFAVSRLFERKYILTFGFTIMVLSMGVLAIYNQRDLTVTTMRLVPVILLGMLVFGHGVSWGMPFVVMAECLNFEIRARVLGMMYAYSQIIKLMHLHSHQYIEDYLGVYVLFYFFCAINIYGGVYSLFIIPDIKNKTVKEIERQMKRIPLLKFTNK